MQHLFWNVYFLKNAQVIKMQEQETTPLVQQSHKLQAAPKLFWVIACQWVLKIIPPDPIR